MLGEKYHELKAVQLFKLVKEENRTSNCSSFVIYDCFFLFLLEILSEFYWI